MIKNNLNIFTAMRLHPKSSLLTVQEVASHLQLSALTLYKYIKEGKLEALEFGGHYRIEKESLERFIRRHRILHSAQKRSES